MATSNLNPIQANGWHIADNPAIFEPARTNNFEFIVKGIDSLVKAGIDEVRSSDDVITDGQEIIRLSVNKAKVPNFTQSEITVVRGNTKTYFAGPIEYQSGEIEVNDYIGKSGKSVLLAWQRLSGDSKTGVVGRAVDYKKDCELIEYAPDYTQIRSWTLKGCWITGIQEQDFDVNSSEKKTVTATIRYDRAYLN